ncbi:MAG: SGNH/GDSL hydrolase family protein [Bdellovibrionales bacterium]|nr:SGNH/GDSL hydrolase family protein [Bdellovibrionales bacterium]
MLNPTQRVHTSFWQSLGLVIFGCFIAVVLLELALQFLPVHDSMLATAVNEQSPVARYLPNRDFTYSLGADFAIVNRGHVNNAGFVNDQDYDTQAHSPLVAVIGDSYVEALMVPYKQTLQGTLARAVGKEGRVYSFAMSGAPLSQYLVYADYARSYYRPDALIFVIVGNDFDESLPKYREGNGKRFHYFKEVDGKLSLSREDYLPSPLRRLLRKSALLRYLYINVHLPERLANWRAAWASKGTATAKAEPQYVGNTSAGVDPERLRLSESVVDKFFEMLPEKSGLDPSHILFVVDGMRPELYSLESYRSAHESYFGKMRSYFMRAAQQRGYELVDLHSYYAAKHKRTGAKFEFERDAHWNAKGHQTAAEAVLQTSLWSHLFPGAHLGIGE